MIRSRVTSKVSGSPHVPMASALNVTGLSVTWPVITSAQQVAQLGQRLVEVGQTRLLDRSTDGADEHLSLEGGLDGELRAGAGRLDPALDADLDAGHAGAGELDLRWRVVLLDRP